MPHDAIATCPICDHELSVTRLHCRECGTTLEGEFSVGRFGRLNRDQLSLLESFLRSRGNLREMERELSLSYPTLRNRVEALVRALGLGDQPVSGEGTENVGAPDQGHSADAGFVAAERRRTLERLARREISAEDAAAILRALGSASPAGATGTPTATTAGRTASSAATAGPATTPIATPSAPPAPAATPAPASSTSGDSVP